MKMAAAPESAWSSMAAHHWHLNPALGHSHAPSRALVKRISAALADVCRRDPWSK